MRAKFSGISHGKSMYPFLKPGTRLSVQKTSFQSLHVGDIVVFFNRGEFVGHRIIWKTSTYLVTKGDNRDRRDPFLAEKDIVGKVIRFSYKGTVKRLDTYSARFVSYIWLAKSVITWVFPAIYRKLSNIIFKP